MSIISAYVHLSEVFCVCNASTDTDIIWERRTRPMFETPEVKVIKFDVADVITTSCPTDGCDVYTPCGNQLIPF